MIIRLDKLLYKLTAPQRSAAANANTQIDIVLINLGITLSSKSSMAFPKSLTFKVIIQVAKIEQPYKFFDGESLPNALGGILRHENLSHNNKFKSDSQRLALSLLVSLVFMAQCFR
ncbi:hypothetical protein J4H63_14730 [Vibrio alginolyticus]|uniref:hypothetical protein n=1 Tax=Vibrio alginolyticus TaxID=663 RepID=UPI001BD622D4|nr:hypothetical protein [Vibrio alginolyticus]MBS9970678.1 hypothetical protein [Vibrio alginolyticus]